MEFISKVSRRYFYIEKYEMEMRSENEIKIYHEMSETCTK